MSAEALIHQIRQVRNDLIGVEEAVEASGLSSADVAEQHLTNARAELAAAARALAADTTAQTTSDTRMLGLGA